MVTVLLILAVAAPLWLGAIELATRSRRPRDDAGEPGESPLLKRPPQPRHPL